MSASVERRLSKRLQTRRGSAPYVKPDKSGDNSTGLTKYMGDSSLNWDGDATRRRGSLVHHHTMGDSSLNRDGDATRRRGSLVHHHTAPSARPRSRHLCSRPLARAAVSPSSSAA